MCTLNARIINAHPSANGSPNRVYVIIQGIRIQTRLPRFIQCMMQAVHLVLYIVGTLYAVVDGAICELVFAWLYNFLLGKGSPAKEPT